MKRLYKVISRYSMYSSEYQSGPYDSRSEALDEALMIWRQVDEAHRGGWVKIICTSCVWENGHNV